MRQATLTEEERKAARKKSYDAWYARDKANFNQKRRDRYKTDTTYSTKVKEQSRQSKKLKATDTGTCKRIIGGVEMEVFRIGEASNRVGVSVSVLRSWESDGIIPPSIFPGTQRVYTDHQIGLMTELAHALQHATGHIETHEIKTQQKRQIASQWKGN